MDPEDSRWGRKKESVSGLRKLLDFQRQMTHPVENLKHLYIQGVRRKHPKTLTELVLVLEE